MGKPHASTGNPFEIHSAQILQKYSSLFRRCTKNLSNYLVVNNIVNGESSEFVFRESK